jgi:prepilin-type N-terminal cleavage/methylation domain-containing protein
VSTQKASVKKAFTLTELLVSMAILGLIATLTLPHMFMSVDRAKKRAVFKEAYNALALATHKASLEGATTTMDIIPYLNVSKVCMDNATANGCTTHELETEAAVKLSTGATIFNIVNAPNHTERNGIDGAGPPRIGSDIDGVVIGLEEFVNKEYFKIVISVAEEPFNISQGNGTYAEMRNALNTIRPGETVRLRPGEILCYDQACIDMFKND